MNQWPQVPVLAGGVVAVCSRGLMHSRTAEAVCGLIRDWNMKGAFAGRWDCVFTHNEPIPAAQQVAVDRALAVGAPWLLFIEEDMVPPPDLLEQFSHAPVQAVDYRLPGGSYSVNRRDGAVAFCGLGCTLVATEVFHRIERPWFGTRNFTFEGKRLVPTQGCAQYGGQDVFFAYRLQEAGIAIEVVPNVEARHLRIKELGQPGVNDGCHIVEAL